MWKKGRKKRQISKVVEACELEMRIEVGKLRHVCPTELDQRAGRVNDSKDM